MTYPSDWPKADPRRPKSLVSLITEQEKSDLYARKITARQLAEKYGVWESWVSTLFPGRVESLTAALKGKKQLTAARRGFRKEQAQLVKEGKQSILAASEACRVSYRTMARAVQELKARSLPAPNRSEGHE